MYYLNMAHLPGVGKPPGQQSRPAQDISLFKSSQQYKLVVDVFFIFLLRIKSLALEIGSLGSCLECPEFKHTVE